jgi:hypothetical protein
MDTRYWGPPGWRLLHLITFAPSSKTQATVIRTLFELLPFVLPCKYCRASLSEYMEADPVPTIGLPKWLWRIHNCVNAKLRGQGLPTTPDPDFASVRKIYEERMSAGCTRTAFEGWEFLFSIADNHPMARSGRASAPLKDAPPTTGLSAIEKNRWNLLTPEERLPFYEKFWAILPNALPFPEWRHWLPIDASTRSATMSGLWKNRCMVENELELLNKTNYSSLCQELRNHRSGCNKNKRAKTCRKKRR